MRFAAGPVADKLVAVGKPRVGISACLLGDAVRYDGGHKRNRALIEGLGPRVEWVRVCPEMEIGMGTPREPVRLVRDGRRLRMIATLTGLDYTDTMETWARTRIEALAREELSGYILKKDSPSCGIDGVKVFDAAGDLTGEDRGLFAGALLRRFPELPIEDERRLENPDALERFLQRVLAYRSRSHV
jgi:uncharacterized protein YbbK (DUF523 family)